MGLTWEAVNKALLLGRHGLPGGETLARLLRRERGRPERRSKPPDAARRREAVWLRGQGLTQEEIARRLGVSQQHVSRLLQGEAAPRPAGKDDPAADAEGLWASVRARLADARDAAAALGRALEVRGSRIAAPVLAEVLGGLGDAAERLRALRALLPPET
jgi:transcriptional regulator with XRE-family HTH domain